MDDRVREAARDVEGNPALARRLSVARCKRASGEAEDMGKVGDVRRLRRRTEVVPKEPGIYGDRRRYPAQGCHI